MATATETAGGASRFVPIRPAFRPLLPKPAPAPTEASPSEPVVMLKSQRSRTIVKKRKDQHPAITAAAAAAVAVHSTKQLPQTISPASLFSKRQRSPEVAAEDEAKPQRRTKSPTLAPAPAVIEDSLPFSPLTTDTPGTPLSLFNHVEDPQSPMPEEFDAGLDAGLEAVAGLDFEFEQPLYAHDEGFDADFFTSNMDMFS